MKYQIKYRNKMYGYKAFFILNKKFETKNEAEEFIKNNQEGYIDKIEIQEVKE